MEARTALDCHIVSKSLVEAIRKFFLLRYGFVLAIAVSGGSIPQVCTAVEPYPLQPEISERMEFSATRALQIDAATDASRPSLMQSNLPPVQPANAWLHGNYDFEVQYAGGVVPIQAAPNSVVTATHVVDAPISASAAPILPPQPPANKQPTNKQPASTPPATTQSSAKPTAEVSSPSAFDSDLPISAGSVPSIYTAAPTPAPNPAPNPTPAPSAFNSANAILAAVPGTQPATLTATQPATLSATQPATLTATQPATQPATLNMSALSGNIAPGQLADLSTPVSAIDAPLSVDLLESRLQQLQSSSDGDPAVRTTLTEIYKSILGELKIQSSNEGKVREMAAKAEAAPSLIAELKRRKENPVKYEPISNFRLRTARQEDLQSMLQQEQTSLQTISDMRSSLETKISFRDARKKELHRLISDQKAIQSELSKDIAAKASDTIDVRVSEARAVLARAKLAASIEQARLFEQEFRQYDAEVELLPLQRELLILDEKNVQSNLKCLNSELNSRRETQIEGYRKQAEAVLDASPTATERIIAERISKRTSQWLDVARSNRAIVMESEQSTKRREMWQERFDNMSERIKRDVANGVTGLNSWVGLILRRQRSELPNLRKLNQQLEDYQSKMQQNLSMIMELDDQRARNSAMESFDSAEMSEMRTAEATMIAAFKLDADEYSNSLMEIAERKSLMINLIEKYKGFVDENILWIRSAEPLQQSHLEQTWPALRWLFDIQSWKAVAYALITQLRNHLTEAIAVLSTWLFLLVNTRKMRRKVKQLGDQAAKGNCTKFRPTANAVVLTLLIASTWPALLVYVGLRLYASGDPLPFVQQVGFGFIVAARFFFVVEVLRQICRSGGLADRHLNWSNGCHSQIRRHLRWCLDVSLPLIFVVGMVYDGGEETWENLLGRVAFMGLMAICAGGIFSILHPNHGAPSDYIARNRGGWIERLRFVWFSGLVAAPLMMAGAAAAGYYYTATKLAMLSYQTAMSLVLLYILYSLATRSLLLSRRRLAIAQAKSRLEEIQRESALAANGNSITNDVRSTEFRNEIRNEQSAIDLAAINAQTMSLVSACTVMAGLFMIALIWSDVLPAFNVLKSIVLWQIDGELPTTKIPITLADVLFAIPIGVMTIFAARNLPGLLEIALLQHLPIENAARYAITTVSRYVLLSIGIAMTFNAIGVRWESIQWLVAALGVGLGFGLQEIFANFISGLILLFEQPVRVGDVITIGETSGAVAKIRMRATTITNWDRQELIVPNKDLITGRLLNWTLSDSTNRLVLSIGIAYGSDTDLACQILLDVCERHPNVLADPAPSAFFESFQDSTLELTLRFFLQTLDLRLKTRHELLSEIHRQFSQNGIEIAFPQRDLHLRSIPAGLNDFLSTFSNSEGSAAPSQSKIEPLSQHRKAG